GTGHSAAATGNYFYLVIGWYRQHFLAKGDGGKRLLMAMTMQFNSHWRIGKTISADSAFFKLRRQKLIDQKRAGSDRARCVLVRNQRRVLISERQNSRRLNSQQGRAWRHDIL